MTNKMATLDGVAQQKPCTNNVPPAPEVVNISPLRKLRLANELPAAKIVGSVQRMYPGFDKYLLSKAERPDTYGIELRTDAMIIEKHA
jgi:hypothetical protein